MQKESNFYTVDGVIQALHVVPGVLNLVEDIQKGALFTGVMAGLAGEAGMLANAASLALYEGENVEHIASLINGQLAIGTFEWLQDLNVGDEVKLVVSDIEDGPLLVHAILRKSDQLLWTPYSVDYTRHGWIMHAVKLCSAGVIFMWALALIFNFFAPAFTTLKEIITWIGFPPIVIMIFVGFMGLQGVLDFGEEAEQIFKTLGVPKFERFCVNSYSIMRLHFMDDPNSLKKSYIFKFADALVAHKKKFKLP